jgi:hypothetical protein
MTKRSTYIIIPKEILNGVYATREYRLYSNGVFKNHRTNVVVKPSNRSGRPRVLGRCPFRIQYDISRGLLPSDADNSTEPTTITDGVESETATKRVRGYVYPLDGNWWDWNENNIAYTGAYAHFLEQLSNCTRKRRGDNHRVSTRLYSRHIGRVQRRVVEMRLAGHPVREIMSELGIGKRTVYHIFRDYNAKVIKERENESSE